ncbi:glycosyltransferase [Aeromonas rivipollensis]|uniref:glycosyltransferase n=1 Tax=Aeromonas rivipollensis TaxID=948519 RepID=UPI0038D1134A
MGLNAGLYEIKSVMPFSVLMSIYIKDNAEHFELALKSIDDSMCKPSEVCIVCDGPLTLQQEDILDKYSNILPLNILRLENNVGLGLALNKGMSICSNEIIARFDSDDICFLTRFEEQYDAITSHNLDIVGSWVSEFDVELNEPHAIRKVPQNHYDIVGYAKYRNPFNHMSVMFKKTSVISAGGYKNEYLYEDYALWVRMIMNGARCANIQKVLVGARTGNGMERRRGGLKYAKAEFKAQYYFYNEGFIPLWQLIYNIILRLPIRVLPGKVRKFIYRKILRK